MRTIHPLFFLAAGIAIMLNACSKSGIQEVPPPAPPVAEAKAPEGFNYETAKTIQLQIRVQAPNGSAVAGVVVNLLDKTEEAGGRQLFTGITNASGVLEGSVEVPTYLETIVVDPQYVGIIRQVSVRLSGNRLSCLLGGPNGVEGDIIPAGMEETTENFYVAGGVDGSSVSPQNFTYQYLGSYSTNGVPAYLESRNDVVDAKLLEYVNASLPERLPVPTYHPEYLRTDAATNLVITQESDIWITFLHEGAGWLNSLAFYTYPTGNKPATISDINKLTIILPNASLSGSGGGLQSGNKVKIGRFSPGVTIAFAVVANGWSNSTRKVGAGNHIVFGDDNLNPETDSKLKRHTVLLHDAERQLFLVGFEDMRRDAGSDNDFNDLVYYATSNPVTAISTNNVNPIDKPGDSDSDGVSDVYDKFPNDPTRAYIQYFPSENAWGTLAFEDLWPATGDYDMNDLVVDYRYAVVKNGTNKAVSMEASYTVKAIGASFTNGFGVQFPFSPSIISATSGGMLTGNVPVNLATNGLESGQSKAVIIPFDNAFKVVKRNGTMVNVTNGSAFVVSDTIRMNMTFSSPQLMTVLGTFPFNPFLIKNGNRGAEVHLPGMQPTSLANTALFNTAQDKTIPAQSRYYLTKDNMPFAVSFVEEFEHPVEKNHIGETYLKFSQWAKSGGVQYSDWYKQNGADYRIVSRIFKR